MFVTAPLVLSQSAAGGATNSRQVWVDQLDPTLRPVAGAIDKKLPGLLRLFTSQGEYDDAYPTQAMREGRQGRVNFTVHLNSDGLVTACEITLSSGSADLDQATCAITQKRARFKPAIDDDGHAMDGVFSSTFNWVIPKG